MNTDQAMQHGLGYAAGREDASGVRTVAAASAPDGVGFMAFAEAYAAGWTDYNRDMRHFMTNARSAYDAWQETGGVSIFRDESDRTVQIVARRRRAYPGRHEAPIDAP